MPRPTPPAASSIPPRLVRRGLLAIAAVLLLIAAEAGCMYSLRLSHYNAGKAAIQREDWATARAELWPVFKADPRFRDIEALLRTTFYGEAAAAVAASDWQDAAVALVRLEAFDPDHAGAATLITQAGPVLAASLHSARSKAWQTGTPRIQRAFPVAAQHMRLSPDGDTLAATGGGELLLWQSGAARPTRLDNKFAQISDVEFSPDSAFLVAAGSLSGAQIYTRAGLTHGSAFGNSANAAAFSPDGSLLAVASQTGVLEIYRIADRALLRSVALQGSGATVSELAFSPDGTMLLGALASRISNTAVDGVFAWGVSDGALRWSHFELFGAIALALSPDGAAVAVGNGAGEVGLYTLTDGAELWRVRDHSIMIREREPGRQSWHKVPLNGVLALSYSPDGSILASGGVKGLILYSSSGATLREIARDAGAGLPAALSFGRDSQPLVSLDYEKGVIFWRALPPVAAETERLGQILPGATASIAGPTAPAAYNP